MTQVLHVWMSSHLGFPLRFIGSWYSGAKNWTRDLEMAIEMDSCLEEEDTDENGAETGKKL